MRITNDMINYYIKRTAEHIDRVDKNLERIKYAFPKLDVDVLDQLGLNHDASKYSKTEQVGYILITEKYKDGGRKDFSIEETTLMDKAWEHHRSNNRHHPEYHKNIIDMNKYDLAEMVADWAAISQEKNTSLLDWANKNIGTRFKFNEVQSKLIYSYIDIFTEVL